MLQRIVDRQTLMFLRNLFKLPLSFVDELKQEIDFQKEFGRVIELSGPLHVSFHVLKCVHNLCGGLLKTM